MATKLAQAQLAELPERVGVLETRVENITEKLVDLKSDVREMHDCLDNTRDTVITQLHLMTDEYRTNAAKYYEHAEKLNKEQATQHTELAGKMDASYATLEGKIKELEKIKAKYTMYAMAFAAFLAGAGIIGHKDLPSLLKFFGL